MNYQNCSLKEQAGGKTKNWTERPKFRPKKSLVEIIGKQLILKIEKLVKKILILLGLRVRN